MRAIVLTLALLCGAVALAPTAAASHPPCSVYDAECVSECMARWLLTQHNCSIRREPLLERCDQGEGVVIVVGGERIPLCF